jgi:hypothetical protein
MGNSIATCASYSPAAAERGSLDRGKFSTGFLANLTHMAFRCVDISRQATPL